MPSLCTLLAAALPLAAHAIRANSGDSALNLLDTTSFFVCNSKVLGMNGHYVLSDLHQSDQQTPVFIREDGDHDDLDQDHDFRLYRHNGFWLFADVAEWPPKTHYRCDPTKRIIDGVDTLEACSVSLETPPRVGYSPVSSDVGVDHLELHENDCAAPHATPRAEL